MFKYIIMWMAIVIFNWSDEYQPDMVRKQKA